MSMFSQWFTECRMGDPQSCAKLHFYGWVLPQLEKSLSSIFDSPVIIVPRGPMPDPIPEHLHDVLRDRDLGRALSVGTAFKADPYPQPSIPIEAQLSALRQFHSAMSALIKQVDTQIKAIEAIKK